MHGLHADRYPGDETPLDPGTVVVGGIGETLSASGLLEPVLSSVLFVTSEWALILNSARRLRRKNPIERDRSEEGPESRSSRPRGAW